MRSELLLKPHWNYKDLCEYIGCKKTKAFEVIKIVKEQFNGSIRFNDSCVKRDSVLSYLGTSIERECYIKQTLEKGGGVYEKV